MNHREIRAALAATLTGFLLAFGIGAAATPAPPAAPVVAAAPATTTTGTA